MGQGNKSGYAHFSDENSHGINEVALREHGQAELPWPINSSIYNVSNATNCTNDYCVSDEAYVDMIEAYIFPTALEWIFIALYICVFFFGLSGNFLVCVVVWKNQHMRTVTNLFIVNLSLADLLVIIVCLPPTVIGDVTETWFLGSIMCKIIKYIQGVSVAVSVMTLTVISVERYYAICHPLRFKSTITRARLFILGIWVTAMLLLIPEVVVLDIARKFEVELTTLLTVCRPGWPDHSQAVYQLFLSIALFFLPFVLMGAAYTRIAICLWSNSIPTEQSSTPLNQQHTPTGRTSAEAQLMARRKVAKMLIAVVAIFGVCYFPVHLVNVLRYTGASLDALSGQGSIYFALVAHWLCYFNSAVNPLIYNFMSARFQKEFQNACSSCPCKFRGSRAPAPKYPYGESAYSYRYSNSMTHTEAINMNTIINEDGATSFGEDSMFKKPRVEISWHN